MNIEVKVIEILNEDGTACATAGNSSGNAAIVAAQPSTNVGTTIGTAYTSGGGTTGSGDVGVHLTGHPFQKEAGKYSRRKKNKKVFQLKQDYTGEKPGKIKKFSAWSKN
jgi:hypothetical protein